MLISHVHLIRTYLRGNSNVLFNTDQNQYSIVNYTHMRMGEGGIYPLLRVQKNVTGQRFLEIRNFDVKTSF